jgi:hypothetical protein
MQFVDMTNAVEVRTVTDTEIIADSDISIAMLDSALPTNRFTPAAIFASTFTNYLPYANIGTYHLPVVSLDRAEVASCIDVWAIERACVYTTPVQSNRYAYYSIPVGGDSGNPSLIVTSNAAPVLLSCWYGPTVGPGLAYYASQIQTSINGMGGTATNLTYADLSEYNTY